MRLDDIISVYNEFHDESWYTFENVRSAYVYVSIGAFAAMFTSTLANIFSFYPTSWLLLVLLLFGAIANVDRYHFNWYSFHIMWSINIGRIPSQYYRDTRKIMLLALAFVRFDVCHSLSLRFVGFAFVGKWNAFNSAFHDTYVWYASQATNSPHITYEQHCASRFG